MAPSARSAIRATAPAARAADAGACVPLKNAPLPTTPIFATPATPLPMPSAQGAAGPARADADRTARCAAAPAHRNPATPAAVVTGCGSSRPDGPGPVCNTCYLEILNRPSECPRCRASRPLIGLDTDGTTICGPCSGIDADYTCTRCGRSGNPYKAGLCAHCVLDDRLHDLLAGPDGTVAPQLQPVHQALATAQRPRSVIYWLAHSPSVTLLARLTANGEPLSHELFDALPPGRNEYYVRQLLVTTGVLPERDDDVERLPTWLDTTWLDTTLADKPAEHARLIRPFAHWFLLRRARRRAATRRQPAVAGVYLRTQIRIALKLLAWLDEHNLTLADLDQLSLDTWLANGNTNSYNIRNFLIWAASRGIAPTLTVPLRPRQQPEQMLDDTERWNLLRRCLTDDTIPLDTRAATALLLLFGLPISRTRHLTIDQLDIRKTGSFLRTGRHPLPLPPKLANLLKQLADTPHTAARLSRGDSTSHWLFPGLTPGRPTSQLAFTHKLRNLGINARTARNAALISLANELPVPILANVLGLATTTAERWAHLAKRDWAAYIAERANDPHAQTERRNTALKE
jgi:hypothetical protein